MKVFIVSVATLAAITTAQITVEADTDCPTTAEVCALACSAAAYGQAQFACYSTCLEGILACQLADPAGATPVAPATPVAVIPVKGALARILGTTVAVKRS